MSYQEKLAGYNHTSSLVSVGIAVLMLEVLLLRYWNLIRGGLWGVLALFYDLMVVLDKATYSGS